MQLYPSFRANTKAAFVHPPVAPKSAIVGMEVDMM